MGRHCLIPATTYTCGTSKSCSNSVIDVLPSTFFSGGGARSFRLEGGELSAGCCGSSCSGGSCCK